MPLTRNEKNTLERAILGYGYSLAYLEYEFGQVLEAPNRAAHEEYIRRHLIHDDLRRVKHGLANVQYWGNVSSGYAQYRTDRFRNRVRDEQLESFRRLVSTGRVPTPREIRALQMPYYSAMSFVTKILMFLDPQNLSVLDLKISAMRVPGGTYALDDLTRYPTSIPITHHNSAVYSRWCSECTAISDSYFQGRYRAVDVERGFFSLIGNQHGNSASQIYHSWR